MAPRCTNVFTTVLFLSLVTYVDLHTISLCQTPEKNTNCILECKTSDFNHPVTFAHPTTKDVGSCVSQDKCKSHYNYYNLSQSTLNGFITKFHIAKLNRQRDEGEWACTYGNEASNIMNLTVHSSPLSADVEVKPKQFKVLEIRCVCSCIYPVNSVKIHITIINQDNLRSVERELRNLQPSDASVLGCAKEEYTLFGSMEILQDNWPGRSIDIQCICEDSIIGHTITKKMTYIFEGAPEKPTNFELISNFSDYLEIKWKKGFNGGFNQSFVIKYKSSDGSLITLTKADDRKTTELRMNLTGLTANTTYEVWIYAENEKGRSESVGLNSTTLAEIGIVIPTSIPIYMRVVIPLIGCGLGSIFFTILTYSCVLNIFKRMSKSNAHIHDELNVFKWNMHIYKTGRLFKYTALWICVVVVSYIAAFTLKIDYVIKIIVISLLLGVFLAVISNTVLWSIFIFDYIRYQRHLKIVTETLESEEEKTEKIELGEKVRNLIVNSKTMIKDRMNEKTFVKTSGYLEGWKKSLQYGVVMYTGAFGDGRTTNAYHIMNKWVVDYGYTPIILNQLKKLDKMITANEKYVILIKGALCNVIKTKMMDEEITTYFPMIMTWVRKGRTKVIMTNQTKTLNDNRVQFKNIELFDEKYHIDLSDKKYRLTKKEKEQILRKHCKANGIKILDKIIEKDIKLNEGGSKDIDKTATKEEIQKEVMNTENQSLIEGQSESKKMSMIDETYWSIIEICEDNTPQPVAERAEKKIRNKKSKKPSFITRVFKPKQKSNSTKQDTTAEKRTLLKEKDDGVVEEGNGNPETEKYQSVAGGSSEILQTEKYAVIADGSSKERKTETGDVAAERSSETPQTLKSVLVSEIVETEPSIGYPESCALFCKNKAYTKMSLEFFLQPSEKIIQEINQLKASKNKDESLQYEVLQILFEGRGKVGFKEGKVKVRFDRKMHKISLDFLNGLYITKDEDGDYVFIHNSIYVAVGLSMAEENSNNVLEKCNWNFLRHHTKLEGEEYNKDVTYLIITPKQHGIIKKRFFRNLDKDSINRRCDYISKMGTAFLKNILDEVLNDEELNKILRESCTKERGVFVHACKQERRELMVELWNRYKNYIPKQIVDYCHRRVKDKSLDLLLTQWMQDAINK